MLDLSIQIIVAMIINYESNEGYNNFNWPTRVSDNEVMGIHALGVHPRYSGHSYAKKWLDLLLNMQNKIIKKRYALIFLRVIFLLKDYILAWVSSIFIPYKCTIRTLG